MAKNNFYETLGLQRGASAKDIKTAYYAVSVSYCREDSDLHLNVE